MADLPTKNRQYLLGTKSTESETESVAAEQDHIVESHAAQLLRK